jgi:Ca2+-binding EF-hand superfamily protein
MSSVGGISIGSLQFLASHRQRMAGSAEAGAGQRFEALRNVGSSGDAAACDSLGIRCSPKALDALISLQEHRADADKSGERRAGSATLVDRLFEKFDADGDGAITKTELEAAFAARDANTARADVLFGKLDADGDGSISKDELKDAFALAASLAERLFAKLDADGNGKISEAEFEAAFAAHGGNAKRAEILFAKLDADGDGAISQSELAAAIEQRRDRERRRDDDSAASVLPMRALIKAATSSETTKAADGSTTTVLTFADGTTITVRKPAMTDDAA